MYASLWLAQEKNCILAFLKALKAHFWCSLKANIKDIDIYIYIYIPILKFLKLLWRHFSSLKLCKFSQISHPLQRVTSTTWEQKQTTNHSSTNTPYANFVGGIIIKICYLFHECQKTKSPFYWVNEFNTNFLRHIFKLLLTNGLVREKYKMDMIIRV